MTALICIVPPSADENAIGYLRRLASENGYSGWKSLLRAIDVNPSLNAVVSNSLHIANSLGIDPGWLESLSSAMENGADASLRHFRRLRSDPVCPHCLADEPILRRPWSHSYVTACPRHGTFLIDSCPSCGEPLDIHRQGIVHCDCGFDLRDAETEVASRMHLWISARLGGDMTSIAGVPEIGSEADYPHLHRLLFLIAVRADPNDKVQPENIERPRNLAEAREFLEPAVSILCDWPKNFEAHVGERLAAGNQHQFSLSARLGQWYLALNTLCNKPPAFEEVWRAFSDAVIDHFDGNLRSDANLRPSPGKVRRYMSVAEAVVEIGTAHATLSAAIRRGKVKAHITKRGTSYELVLIERDEVARIAGARKKWILDSEAAEILGVPTSVVSELKRAELITVDNHWKADFLKGGPIEVESLHELVARTREHMVEGAVAETIPFSRLTRRRTTDGLAMIRLYQAIATGKVRAVGHDAEHALGGFLFATDEVQRYLGSVALDDGFTLTQLEKTTGWKYEAISFWVDEGLLSATHVLLHGRSARVVSLAALMAFRNTWLPVSDLAQELGTKPSALSTKLALKGIPIHGQKVLPDGAKRGGLIRIADVVRSML